MKDTAPAIERKFRAMLLERSGAERLKMGCSMHTPARALAKREVKVILDAIRQLMAPPEAKKRRIGFLVEEKAAVYRRRSPRRSFRDSVRFGTWALPQSPESRKVLNGARRLNFLNDWNGMFSR